MGLRTGTFEDAAAIAAIHVNTWRSAYSGIIPRSYLDALSIVKRRKMWENILSGSGGIILVAEEKQGGIIGFASFGPSRDDDSHCTGEVYGIYVDTLRWGKGCGRKLMCASEEELKSQGFCSATLWVFQANKKARRFYETAGYEADGSAKTVTIADTELVELRYRKSLEFTG